MAKEKKEIIVPYKLIIHTTASSYEFLDELAAFCFGKLFDRNERDFNKYLFAFWNGVCNDNVYSLKDYEKLNKPSKKLSRFYEKYFFKETSELDYTDLEKFNEQERLFEANFHEKEITRLYDTYLVISPQEIDGGRFKTYYNVCSYNDDSKKDSMYIQLFAPLSEHFEELIITRIKKFFELNIIDVMKEYECKTIFLKEEVPNSKEIKLLDLELIDECGNIVKKYV